MQRSSSSFLSYDAIRSIVGQCTQAVQELLDTGLTHTALSTDTIRVSVNGVQFADTPVAAALADICSGIDGDVMSYEQMATRQLAALLYALLTKTPSGANTTFDLNMLPADVPTEFRVICKLDWPCTPKMGKINRADGNAGRAERAAGRVGAIRQPVGS